MSYRILELRRLVCAAAILFATSIGATASHAQDVANSSDHPLFPNRMPGYSISVYQQQGFSSYNFRTKPPQLIEGKYTRIHYYLKDPQQNPGAWRFAAITRTQSNPSAAKWCTQMTMFL